MNCRADRWSQNWTCSHLWPRSSTPGSLWTEQFSQINETTSGNHLTHPGFHHFYGSYSTCTALSVDHSFLWRIFHSMDFLCCLHVQYECFPERQLPNNSFEISLLIMWPWRENQTWHEHMSVCATEVSPVKKTLTSNSSSSQVFISSDHFTSQ